ncbi:MAG: NAD(P)H-binding protein [Flavobacterium sp.]
MKIVLTGSLGNIGKPLATQLVQNGHNVTVISSTHERKQEIESLGAEAATGSIMDIGFLSKTFQGADVVYLMEAVSHTVFFDHDFDIIEAYKQIATNYKKALLETGVKKVIHLSSIGGHTNEGNGILVFHYEAERILNELPEDVSIKFMRPVGFFTNLYRSMQTIKNQNAIIHNFGGDTKQPWVSPHDIADAIAEEIGKPFDGRSIRYIASEEISPNEIAQTLGKVIGIPELKWMEVSDEKMLDGMLSAGMNRQTAEGFVAMQAAQRSGILYEDYYKNRPVLGKTKLEDFAKEFAVIYKAL